MNGHAFDWQAKRIFEAGGATLHDVVRADKPTPVTASSARNLRLETWLASRSEEEQFLGVENILEIVSDTSW